jgi:hypothetical protein
VVISGGERQGGEMGIETGGGERREELVLTVRMIVTEDLYHGIKLHHPGRQRQAQNLIF